jgi:hypothetical protein
MQLELIKTGTTCCTVYQLEDNLAALVNTLDLAEGPEARAAVLDAIGESVRAARDKRDRVVAFLRHCADQQRFADEEIERIGQRKRQIAKVQSELESHLVRIVEEFAPADRKGVKRLEGNVSTMRLQKNPDSVLILDPALVPVAFKDAVLTMPAYVWEALLQRLTHEERAEFERRVTRLEFRPDKKALASELKAGNDIAGADLQFGQYRLVVS